MKLFNHHRSSIDATEQEAKNLMDQLDFSNTEADPYRYWNACIPNLWGKKIGGTLIDLPTLHDKRAKGLVPNGIAKMHALYHGIDPETHEYMNKSIKERSAEIIQVAKDRMTKNGGIYFCDVALWKWRDPKTTQYYYNVGKNNEANLAQHLHLCPCDIEGIFSGIHFHDFSPREDSAFLLQCLASKSITLFNTTDSTGYVTFKKLVEALTHLAKREKTDPLRKKAKKLAVAIRKQCDNLHATHDNKSAEMKKTIAALCQKLSNKTSHTPLPQKSQSPFRDLLKFFQKPPLLR